MPTPSPYFLDGTSLVDSTTVYSNSGLTIPAPDGYYSDGVNIREQVGGILLPVQPCPSCGFPCNIEGDLSGDQGEYRMTFDTGALPGTTGAIVIRFRVGNAPDGMIVNYDGNVYNEFSSPFFGYLAGAPGGPTYLGNSAPLIPPCTLLGPHTLNVFNWDGSTFVPSGGTNAINVVAGELALTASAPDDPTFWSVLVVPKTAASPSTISLTVYAVCPSTSFLFSVACATKIQRINASIRFDDPEVEGFCDSPLVNYLYPVRVNGIAPYLGLYDWIFIDENGENKAADGFYKTNNLVAPNDTIQVQDGVIIAITDECP
jgi:hypothetical protein